MSQLKTKYIQDNAITDAKLRQGSAVSVIGRSANTTGNVADISASANGQVFQRSSNALSWALLVNANIDSAAAIDFSKFAALTSGNILVGSVGNVATSVVMSGDATIVASGAITLATVNSNVGSFGSSTSIPSFTVNAKGLITAAAGNSVIAPAGTLSGTTLNATVVSSSLTSVGTIATGVWNGTAVDVAHGGSGQTSLTAYAVLAGGTTSTGALQQVSGVGTSGQVLTSNGAAALPTWQAAGGGSSADVPIGTILLTSSGKVPDTAKYLYCDGSNVLRSTYTNLSTLPDGLTATVRTAAASQTFRDGACDGSGNIILVYGGSDVVHKSTDSGATWATDALPAAAGGLANYIAWMGGSVNKFVILTSNLSTRHYYGTPGSWTSATTLTSKTWTGLAANDAGTIAIAVCSDDGVTNKSTNGTSFSASGTLGSASTGDKYVTWMQTAGLFVVFENNNNSYWTSTDGTTWTTRTLPASPILYTAPATRRDVAVTTGSLFIKPAAQNCGLIFKTTDGINWTILNNMTDITGALGTSSRLARAGSSILVMTGSNGVPYVMLSYDEGISWIVADISNGVGTSYFASFPTLKISSTSFLSIFAYTSGASNLQGLATVAIDSTKAKLPNGKANQYIRYV